MRKVLTITALLMAALLVFSCANGGGSDSDNSPVKVSFAVETPHESLAKIASVDTPNTTFTYWYKAVPQWEGDDFDTIQGSTNDEFVQIANYPTSKDIGLFAQGSWKFYAQVKSGNAVVYQSETTPANVPITYINATTHSVTLDVTRVANGTATVSIDIEVPDTSARSTLTATYSDGAGSVTLNKNAQAATRGTGWSRFTGTSSALTTGSYVFKLTSSDGTNEVGGAMLAFDVIAGVNRTITGTIENGVWQTTLITINVPTFEMEIEAANGATSVVKSTNLVYTCTASSTNITGNIAYQWYVNDSPVNDATSATYTFNQANPGYYYVACKAYIDGKAAGSMTLPVTVTNN